MGEGPADGDSDADSDFDSDSDNDIDDSGFPDADVDADADEDMNTPLGDFGPPIPVSELNTGFGEDDPTLTGNMLEIYFNRGDNIYVATRSSLAEPFGEAVLAADICSSREESTPEITDDGLTLFFNSERPGGLGDSDIYFTTRTSLLDFWAPPIHLPVLSTANDDNSPTPTPDALVLYLVSIRSDGMGSQDIYVASRARRSDSWSAPVLVPNINSRDRDTNPHLSRDGLTLYFTTSRDGDSDIWRAVRSSPSADFDAPEPVPELNTNDGDADPWISPDGRVIYFSSNRNGDYDLFMAVR